MKIMKLYAGFVMNLCAKSIQALVSNLKVLVSIQQINSATRSLQGANNLCSDLRFYPKNNKSFLTHTVLSRLEPFKGLRASLKGVACLIAAAIGIAMSMPMAVAPAAQSMPIKSVKQYAKEKTVNPKQWSCLAKLWGKESAWNHLADNPHSTAFGIPQILGLTTTNPYKQIDLGVKYIKHRYDTPCKAWSHHKNKGWY